VLKPIVKHSGILDTHYSIIGSMKLAGMDVFIAWKLANTTNQGLPFLCFLFFSFFFCERRVRLPGHDSFIFQKSFPL
jgi:hypothetical protein